MLSARMAEATRERAALRLRLASAALGLTLVLLAGDVDRTVAAATLLAYVAGALLLRLAVPRETTGRIAPVATALDVFYASALVSCLPLGEPAWALYAFAIAIAAHRYGAWGAVTATAGSIVAYDVTLAARAREVDAAGLWPVQVLIAVGLLCTELVLLVAQSRRERAEIGAYAVALRDLASAERPDVLLERLVAHAVLGLGADAAGVRADGGAALAPTRGDVSAGTPLEIPLGARRALVARFAVRDERREATVRDLAADAAPLLAALEERETQRRELAAHGAVRDAIAAMGAQREPAAIVAHLAMGASALGGRASVVRRSDGGLVGGEPIDLGVASRLRDLRLPAFIEGAAGPRIAAAAAGAGIALVLVAERELDAVDLEALGALGAAAGALLARTTERDEADAERHELRELAGQLREELRSRDDALASTVHELRTPLTSVTAYGQLIARNLQAALQQLSQLDRLIGDLRRDASAALDLAEVDLARHVREAVQRQRIVNGTEFDVSIEGDGPFVARADAGRLAQVLDNVLGNAVKFSPAGTPVRVDLARDGDRIQIAVTDEGPGLAPEDVERVFDRYYRAQTTSGTAPGLGIGLAVSREIVLAHGGRIWAESAGPGRGSTFRIALPALGAVAFVR